MGADEAELRVRPSAAMIKVVTTGRLTGLPHVVRLRFVRRENDFFVLSGDREADWVRNLLKGGRAKLRTDGHFYLVNAHDSDSERESILSLFSAKYGRSVIESWYGPSSYCIRLTPEGPPMSTGASVGEHSVKMGYADWKAEGRPYYSEVAGAFDSASEEYDATISGNFINVWIRRRSISVLSEIVTPDDVVLEIGSGTGAEALEIARKVSGVVATDISPAMVALLTKKVTAKRLGKRVTPVLAGASELAKVKELIPGGKVRVAYSFNGALNCEPRLDEFVRNLASIIEPGGYFVCSIRNTLCLSEILSYAAILDFRKMTRRKKQPMMISVGGMEIPSRYYPVSGFREAFRPDFYVERTIGLPVLLPPAYLNDYYVRVRPAARFLEGLDKVVSERFPFNRLGDQTLFVFRRIPDW